MPLESLAQRVGEAVLLKIDDVLKDVIAERILHKGEGVGSDLANELGLLKTSGMVDAALQDTAAVTMSSHCNAISADSIKDEL